MHIGPVIRTLRKERKLTQSALAHEADMDPGNLSRIERGLQGLPFPRLERICEALGVSAASIVTSAEAGGGTVAGLDRDKSSDETGPHTNDLLERLDADPAFAQFIADVSRHYITLEHKDLRDAYHKAMREEGRKLTHVLVERLNVEAEENLRKTEIARKLLDVLPVESPNTVGAPEREPSDA